MLAVLPSLVAYAPIAPKGVTRASAPVMMAKSESIPFLDQPPALDGSMAGDIGFDPLLLSNVVPLQWAREAELKHARICMLATAGWVSVDLGFRVPLAPDVGSLQAHDAAVERGPMMLLFVVLATIVIWETTRTGSTRPRSSRRAACSSRSRTSRRPRRTTRMPNS